jgi:hypothetical protein
MALPEFGSREGGSDSDDRGTDERHHENCYPNGLGALSNNGKLKSLHLILEFFALALGACDLTVRVLEQTVI